MNDDLIAVVLDETWGENLNELAWKKSKHDWGSIGRI